MVAKSRSVLVGWKDDMVYQLERVAPTPTQEGIMVPFLWLVSAKVSGRISDSTSAFGKARKTLQKKKQARHQNATQCDTLTSGTTTVVAC